MEELVSRLVDKVGLTEDQARRTVGIVISFVRDAGPPDKVGRLLSALPGADKVDSPFDGMFGGPMGAMAAFNALSAAGLGMSDVQAAAQEFVMYSREKAGSEPVDQVVRNLPGLSHFV